MFRTLTESSPDGAWDLETFVDSASGSIGSWMSYVMMFMGVIGIVWATVLLIKKLTAPPGYDQGSWGSIMIMIMIGGAMTVGGTSMPGLFAPSSEEGEGNEPSPTPSSSTSESPTPAPEPTQQPAPPPAEPADLTWLWITLGIVAAVAILVVGVLLTVMLVKRLRKASRAEAERKRLEEARQERIREIWQSWIDRHKAVKEKVLSAETDWDMIFSYPCLSDATVPQTRDLHRAISAADHASDSMPPGLDETTDISSLPYPKMVLAAEETWQTAFSFAKRTGQKLLPKEERKTIEQIIKLLRMAQDAGGSPSERDVAYSRAQKLIADLRVVKVPERAMVMIEQEQRLMLEAPASSPSPQAGSVPTEGEKKSPIIL